MLSFRKPFALLYKSFPLLKIHMTKFLNPRPWQSYKLPIFTEIAKSVVAHWFFTYRLMGKLIAGFNSAVAPDPPVVVREFPNNYHMMA